MPALRPAQRSCGSKRIQRYLRASTTAILRLTAQLDAGVRQIEIDIFADPKGGLYSHPYGEKLIAQAGLPPDPLFDPDLMDKPGFKVMHVQDVDYRSKCEPFTACLAEVRAWSKSHPNHLPIFILVETKQGALHVPFPTVTPDQFHTGNFRCA